MKTFKLLLLLPGMTILMMVNCVFAQTWTQTGAPTNNWISVASSADGSKLVAIGHGLYVSSNSGASWTQTSAPTNYSWFSVASSADGNKLVAAAGSGQIYISADSGATWTQTSAPTNYDWFSVASSADGNQLVAVGSDLSFSQGVIFTSTNSGATWMQQTNPINKNWFSVVSSADGTKLVIQTPGVIYRSTNSGVSWIQTTPPAISWPGSSSAQVIASSADGTKLAAAFFGDHNDQPCPIYLSTNSGTTWTAASAPSNNWACIASSADGTKLVALAAPNTGPTYNGPIYSSTDSGETWTSNTVPNQEWTSAACSADGGKFVAVSGRFISGLIYTLESTPSPQLNIAPTNGSFKLSWLIPSTNFVMQQSSNLSSWSNVTNPPVLNLTNLQNELVLPPSNSSGFYRLRTP
jgi:photosystem II stability/assembly factor-like uncharacterized protein